MPTRYTDPERDRDNEYRQHKARINEFCTQLADDFAALLSPLDTWKDDRPAEPEQSIDGFHDRNIALIRQQRARNAVAMGRHLRIVHDPNRAAGPRTRRKKAEA